MKFNYSLIAATLVAGTAGGPALAAGTDCPQHFADGQPPQLVNAKLKPRTQELCFEAFAVLHSGVSRTPVYAAEHLTRKNLQAAKELSRKDSFHAEDRLPERDRAELSDYARSGYDRGHMAPNADMPTRKAQGESFSLANMVPQIHENNAGVWAGIEAAARQLASDEGELYVISGPAFVGQDIQQVGRVLVPTHVWKVLYSPKQQRAGAYLVSNDKTKDYSVLSIAELQKLAGINPLPALPQQAREQAMNLPKPQGNRGGGDKKADGKAPEEGSMLDGLLRLLLELFKGIMGR
ncbi:DNA/RNA non-specific endonuclease [Malikia sp.]|uniref:DNA/RNA non-specific endonuclease n=1 Tax=Malikia sp. TaxID=2070706 RepID=UPI00261EA382|nr:DNA/RNA non-specific endonuclease [Malikia sp.]MDD2729536.1 DNA/RNA non-specific endonuclease [Malikia sp.]